MDTVSWNKWAHKAYQKIYYMYCIRKQWNTYENGLPDKIVLKREVKLLILK